MGLNLKEIPTLSAEELFGDRFQPVPMEAVFGEQKKTEVEQVKEPVKEDKKEEKPHRKPYVRRK